MKRRASEKSLRRTRGGVRRSAVAREGVLFASAARNSLSLIIMNRYGESGIFRFGVGSDGFARLLSGECGKARVGDETSCGACMYVACGCGIGLGDG